MTSPSELAAAAISYAGNGWPVLPLKPRDKTPLTIHGLKQATCEPAQVEWWWEQWPEANIGLRTGVAFDVLDLDGTDALASLATVAPGYRHTGPVSATGKGYHLLFAPTGKRNFARRHPGIDFRGQGGYIVAPPSIHPSGHQYRWHRPANLDLPVAPTWLLDMFPPPVERNVERPAILDQARELLDLKAELEALGAQFIHRNGRYVTRCVFGTHRDTDPSLNVYPNETFYCFGCNAWGDALNVRKFRRDGVLR